MNPFSQVTREGARLPEQLVLDESNRPDDFGLIDVPTLLHIIEVYHTSLGVTI
jgi:hypothetical protein